MEILCLLHHFDLMPKRPALNSTEMKFLEPAELFLWAEQLDYSCYFTGKWERKWEVEHYLPRLVEKGYLRTVKLKGSKKLFYTLNTRPNKDSYAVRHGLICTKSLLYFKQSKPGEFISERFFREMRSSAVPEWAVKYDNSIIYFEFSTDDNFARPHLMRKKVQKYSGDLPFPELTPIVLFVFEAPRYKVEYFAQKYGKHPSFYFTDLDSFIDAPYGKQLSSSIYIWGGNGKTYPLE